jgi:hypothetical protein
MLDYFLILILSHLLTDFVFQTETLVSQKHSACKKEKQNALLAHSGIFFITSFVLFLVIEGIQLLSWLLMPELSVGNTWDFDQIICR